jgi:hypothetical protein
MVGEHGGPALPEPVAAPGDARDLLVHAHVQALIDPSLHAALQQM